MMLIYLIYKCGNNGQGIEKSNYHRGAVGKHLKKCKANMIHQKMAEQAF